MTAVTWAASKQTCEHGDEEGASRQRSRTRLAALQPRICFLLKNITRADSLTALLHICALIPCTTTPDSSPAVYLPVLDTNRARFPTGRGRIQSHLQPGSRTSATAASVRPRRSPRPVFVELGMCMLVSVHDSGVLVQRSPRPRLDDSNVVASLSGGTGVLSTIGYCQSYACPADLTVSRALHPSGTSVPNNLLRFAFSARTGGLLFPCSKRTGRHLMAKGADIHSCVSMVAGYSARHGKRARVVMSTRCQTRMSTWDASRVMGGRATSLSFSFLPSLPPTRSSRRPPSTFSTSPVLSSCRSTRPAAVQAATTGVPVQRGTPAAEEVGLEVRFLLPITRTGEASSILTIRNHVH